MGFSFLKKEKLQYKRKMKTCILIDELTTSLTFNFFIHTSQQMRKIKMKGGKKRWKLNMF